MKKMSVEDFSFFSALFLFLTIVSAILVPFLYRIVGITTILFIIFGFACGRRGIGMVWHREEMWWQDNSIIEFLKSGQSISASVALLCAIQAIFLEAGAQMKYSYFLPTLICVFYFISWRAERNIFRTVREAVEKKEKAYQVPQGPYRSFRDEVLRPIDLGNGKKIYLAH